MPDISLTPIQNRILVKSWNPAGVGGTPPPPTENPHYIAVRSGESVNAKCKANVSSTPANPAGAVMVIRPSAITADSSVLINGETFYVVADTDVLGVLL